MFLFLKRVPFARPNLPKYIPSVCILRPQLKTHDPGQRRILLRVFAQPFVSLGTERGKQRGSWMQDHFLKSCPLSQMFLKTRGSGAIL